MLRDSREITHYIALIHKDAESVYGVSFPDVPGVIAAADTLDEALSEAAAALAFASEDWAETTGTPFPLPRSLDVLRSDPDFTANATKAFEQARQLPDDQQDAAGAALLDYLDHMRTVHLTDEQVAEVRRRLADADEDGLSLANVRERLQNRGV